MSSTCFPLLKIASPPRRQYALIVLSRNTSVFPGPANGVLYNVSKYDPKPSPGPFLSSDAVLLFSSAPFLKCSMRSSTLYNRNDYAGEDDGAELYVVVDKSLAQPGKGYIRGAY
jgi:hypothetical protein